MVSYNKAGLFFTLMLLNFISPYAAAYFVLVLLKSFLLLFKHTFSQMRWLEIKIENKHTNPIPLEF